MPYIFNGERFLSKTKNKTADNKNAAAISVNPPKNEQEKNAKNENAAAKVGILLAFSF